MEFGGIWWSGVLGILRGGSVGFCCAFRVMKGDSEVVRGVEGRPEMVVAWVDLGEELGEVSEAFGALVCSGLMEREMRISQRNWGGFSLLSQAGGVRRRGECLLVTKGLSSGLIPMAPAPLHLQVFWQPLMARRGRGRCTGRGRRTPVWLEQEACEAGQVRGRCCRPQG